MISESQIVEALADIQDGRGGAAVADILRRANIEVQNRAAKRRRRRAIVSYLQSLRSATWGRTFEITKRSDVERAVDAIEGLLDHLEPFLEAEVDDVDDDDEFHPCVGLDCDYPDCDS